MAGMSKLSASREEILESEKQHLVQAFFELGDILDKVANTSTAYATALSELTSADIVNAEPSSTHTPFVPPRGRDLQSLLFSQPLRDAQSRNAAIAPTRKRKISNAPPAEFTTKPKRQRRVSDLAPPLPVVAEAPNEDVASDIEGSDDDGSDEAANASSQSVRTPYKALQVADISKAASNVNAAKSEAQRKYEDLQKQIRDQAEQRRASLVYNIGNDNGSAPNSQASVKSRAKGKGKMVTIPAAALTRSLSPEDTTPAIPTSAVRKAIEETMNKKAKKVDARSGVKSYDLPFLATPLVPDALPSVSSSRKGGKAKRGDELSFGASSAAVTRSELAHGMAGGAAIVSSARPAPESEAIVLAPAAKKQKRKKVEKREQVAEEGEEPAVAAEPKKVKKPKKAKKGEASLREQAIMQSMANAAGNNEDADDIAMDDSAVEVAAMLTRMSESPKEPVPAPDEAARASKSEKSNKGKAKEGEKKKRKSTSKKETKEKTETFASQLTQFAATPKQSKKKAGAPVASGRIFPSHSRLGMDEEEVDELMSSQEKK